MSSEKHPEADAHVSSNLVTLRRRLMMTQGEFIQTYLADAGGRPGISVATLSNIERGGVGSVERIVERLSESMGVPANVFRLEPDAFAKNIALFFGRQLAEGEENMFGRMAQVRRASNVEMLVRSLSDYLMESMIKGAMKPGDMLPSDRQLSAMFGVGRTPLREALKVLNVLGLIQILPGKGTFVASQSTDLFFAPLSWSFLLGQSSTGQIVDVRNVLEAESARLAAINATDADLARLDSIFSRMAEAYGEMNFQVFLEMDIDFHLTVAQCSANPIILNLLTTSRKLLSFISRSGAGTLEGITSVFEEHREIYEAIRRRSSTASQNAMKRHLRNAKTRYSLK